MIEGELSCEPVSMGVMFVLQLFVSIVVVCSRILQAALMFFVGIG